MERHVSTLDALDGADRRFLDLFFGENGLPINPSFGSIRKDALFRRMFKGDRAANERLGANGARRAIKSYAEVAGIEGASGHSLRVGTAQELAQRGAKPCRANDRRTLGERRSSRRLRQEPISRQGSRRPSVDRLRPPRR